MTQASPHDPENFPFVVLGNKIDMEESKRMVSVAWRFNTVADGPFPPRAPSPYLTRAVTFALFATIHLHPVSLSSFSPRGPLLFGRSRKNEP